MKIEVRGPVVADSAHMLLKLAVSGTGIIRFGDIIVAEGGPEWAADVPLMEIFSNPTPSPSGQFSSGADNEHRASRRFLIS